MKHAISLYLFLLLCLSACTTEQGRHNYLYDMGDTAMPVTGNYVRITAAGQYSKERQAGWLIAPAETFDSTNNKLPLQMLRDGVRVRDSITFRTDVPDGDYFLSLTLGAPGADEMAMTVSVNGNRLADTVRTPWYRINYRTLRRKVKISGHKAEISIRGVSSGAGLYGIELRPVTTKRKITFKTALEQDTMDVARFATELEDELKKKPENISIINQLDIVQKYLTACRFYEGGGWSWAVEETGMSLIHRLYATADLLEQIVADRDDPLYYKSLYLLAKTYYWLNQEDDELYPDALFNDHFRVLKDRFPDLPLIRMYLGEKIFNEPGFDTVAGNAPLWAVYQHEAMKRMEKVIHWWVLDKQAANGEMGGKYGDDVELLRPWLPAILGADDSVARAGYIRLADGVWNSGILERGYAKKVDDVEHSAELFRDTHPAMFLMNYGDPEYVERCMISMQNFRDVWTGITPLGHRHFRSYYLSATTVLSAPPYGIDAALNARAVHAGLWMAWYNKNPTFTRLSAEWCRAWIADAERTDHGKPAGILPSAVSFANDGIGGDSGSWYDPQMTYDYYRWDHIGHVCELQRHILGMYGITGNKDFLKIADHYADLMTAAKKEPLPESRKPGTADWAKAQLLTGGADHEAGTNPMGKVFAMARMLTHSNRYDQLIKDYGQLYNRYQVTQDKQQIIRGLEEVLTSLRYNYPLLTSEVKFTDRVYMPGSDLLTGMYTGHFGAGYEYPALIATWKHTGMDVSVWVHRGDNRSAQVSLYNFGTEKQVEMRTWQLEPGLYRISTGIDTDNDDNIDQLLSVQEADCRERVNAITITLPSRKTTVVSVEQVKAGEPIPAKQPDLAFTANDMTVIDPAGAGNSTTLVQCRIHNIGNAAARNVRVMLSVDGVAADSCVIPVLEAPDDLSPRWTTVSLKWKAAPGQHIFTVTAGCGQSEITGWNNKAFVVYNRPLINE